MARFVAYGVFDRCRAASKASSRAEGHGAVVGNVPGAFARDFQGLHFVAAAVQELYGRRVNVALGIPVVRQDVDRRGCPYFEAVQVVVVGVRRLALRGVDGFVHVAARVHAFFAVTDGDGYGRQVFARVDVRSARGGQAYGARRRVDAVVAVRVAVRGQAVGQGIAILVSATAGRDLLAFCCLSLFWVQGHADFQGRCVVRRRGGTVVGDGHTRRIADVAVNVGHGVFDRFRVACEARSRGKGDFAGGRVDCPGTFASNGQGGHRTVICIQQFDAALVQGVVALRVAVVRQYVHFNRLACRCRY